MIGKHWSAVDTEPFSRNERMPSRKSWRTEKISKQFPRLLFCRTTAARTEKIIENFHFDFKQRERKLLLSFRFRWWEMKPKRKETVPEHAVIFVVFLNWLINNSTWANEVQPLDFEIARSDTDMWKVIYDQVIIDFRVLFFLSGEFFLINWNSCALTGVVCNKMLTLAWGLNWQMPRF